jgi:RNA polymerase sigma factor (sigma-70 family)
LLCDNAPTRRNDRKPLESATRSPETADLAYAAALAAGDREATRAFEARYRPLVGHALGVALRRWRPETPVVPEDLVQDFVGFLFIDAGARLRTYQGRSPFSAWLYTVALRYFQRRLSRLVGDRRSEVVLAHLPEREDRNPEHLLAAEQDAERVRTVVGALSADERLLVRLFYVEDLNAQEVARTLGKGASAIRMKKMRLLERLRGLLGLPAEPEVDHDDETDAPGAKEVR